MRCSSKDTKENSLVQCAEDHGHSGLHHEFGDEMATAPRTELWWNDFGARASVAVSVRDTILVRRTCAVLAIAGQKVATKETDEAWCVRQLSEYTGLPACVVSRWEDKIITVALVSAPTGLWFGVPMDRVKIRDSEWVRAALALCPSWPRKPLCECCDDRPADDAIDCPGSDLHGALVASVCVLEQASDNASVMGQRIRARRAQQSAAPKYYGTQPEVLPETLPDGTLLVFGLGATPGVLTGWKITGARLSRSQRYDCNYTLLDGSCAGNSASVGGLMPCQIHWESVLVQEAKPSAITVIKTQAEADALFGVGGLCAGLAGAALQEMAEAETKLCACSTSDRPIAATHAHGTLCVYCAHSLAGANKQPIQRYELRESSSAQVMNYSNGLSGDKAARVRLAAFDKRSAPRPTADSRELAKPHPWQCSGEDEP
jgi:hypothetical protein